MSIKTLSKTKNMKLEFDDGLIIITINRDSELIESPVEFTKKGVEIILLKPDLEELRELIGKYKSSAYIPVRSQTIFKKEKINEAIKRYPFKTHKEIAKKLGIHYSTFRRLKGN